MQAKLRLRALAAVVCAASGCNNGPGPTQGFVPTALGRVVVRAESAAGSPLDSVNVVLTPVPSSSGYGVASGTTAASGQVLLTIERFGGPATPVMPDTVRVEVAARVLKRAYLNPQGVGAILRDTVLVTLVAKGQTPTAQTVSFSFALPYYFDH